MVICLANVGTYTMTMDGMGMVVQPYGHPKSSMLTVRRYEFGRPKSVFRNLQGIWKTISAISGEERPVFNPPKIDRCHCFFGGGELANQGHIA